MNLKVTEQLEKRITVKIYTKDNLLEIAHGSIIIDNKPTGRPAGLIEDIWTDANYRKQGLGSQVVQELIKIAKENNCYKRVLMCADHNVNFYKNNGFYIHQNAMRNDL